jgi:hypothetical protein
MDNREFESEHFFADEQDGGFVVKGKTSLTALLAGGPSPLQLAELTLEKWRFVKRVLEETGAAVWDGSDATCAYCRAFARCLHGCPIWVFTGAEGCNLTPYNEEWIDCPSAGTAQSEIEFLEEIKEFVASDDYPRALRKALEEIKEYQEE